MATFAEIRTVRLAIGDPAGVIEVAQVADPAALPLDPGQQAAYMVQSTGRYMVTDKETGAVPADYATVDLLISDLQISQLVAAYGVDLAPCKAYGVIAARLWGRLQVVRTNSGAESTEYTSLDVTYRYYKALAADCKAEQDSINLNSTGRMGRTRQPQVGGGNI
jgi:hypothetical protein